MGEERSKGGARLKYENGDVELLEKDVIVFLRDIGDPVESYALKSFSVLNPQEFGNSDGFFYDETIDFANVNVGLALLVRRSKLIDSLELPEGYRGESILRKLYQHILNHEIYHYRKKNAEAYRLHGLSRFESLNEDEISIVREEEHDAEKFAISQSKKDEDQFLVYLSILIGYVVDRLINLEDSGGKEIPTDRFHMSEREVLARLCPTTLSVGEREAVEIVERARSRSVES